MKKTIVLALIISMCLTLCTPVLASSQIPTMEEYEKLDAAVRSAQNDEEATLAMNNLLAFFDRVEGVKENGIMPMSVDIYPSILDSYVDVTWCSVSPGMVSIFYNVVSIVPSGASLILGYEYPANTHLSGGSFRLGAAIGASSYTMTTPMCASEIQIVGKFSARDFSATKVYRQTYQYPFTDTRYGYKTITSDDVISEIAILVVIGGIGLIRVSSGLGAIIVDIAGLSGLIATLSSYPGFAVEQYYVTTCWFSGGVAYTTLRVWSSEDSYNNGRACIYSSTTRIALPSF